MARLLRGMGVPSERILLEETGTDTLSSVRAVVRLVRDVGPVYVATSGYHLPRCRMLLRLAGIAALACPPPPASPVVWQRWYWRFREAAAIHTMPCSDCFCICAGGGDAAWRPTKGRGHRRG